MRGLVLLAPRGVPRHYGDDDPRIDVAKVGVPMLLLRGSKDDRAGSEDSAALVAAARAAHRSLQYGELDGDDHFFVQLPEETPSTGAQDATPAIDPRVFAAIEAWIAETQ